jgi:DtxR family transcriptional regulator, Mn-dependent transcriptional regulator
MTASVENFVKAIHRQNKLSGADTRLSTIAGLLNITNAAATDMARKLAKKNIVNYTKYKPLSLTSCSHTMALNVIRKHRLLESFLYKTLNLSLHEIHREVEQLEHHTSDFLANKIEKYVGCPSIDPQGDPIPSFDGNIKSDNTQILLSVAAEENMYVIARLFSSEKDFF